MSVWSRQSPRKDKPGTQRRDTTNNGREGRIRTRGGGRGNRPQFGKKKIAVAINGLVINFVLSRGESGLGDRTKITRTDANRHPKKTGFWS